MKITNEMKKLYNVLKETYNDIDQVETYSDTEDELVKLFNNPFMEYKVKGFTDTWKSFEYWSEFFSDWEFSLNTLETN